MKIECWVWCYLYKILQPRKSIWSSKLSSPSSTWEFKLVLNLDFVLNKLLSWKEINYLGFWRKSYIIYLFLRYVEEFLNCFDLILTTWVDKSSVITVNQNHSGTECFVNIRCSDIRYARYNPFYFVLWKVHIILLLFHQTTQLWLFSFWWKLVVLFFKISQCNCIFL